MKLKIDQIKLNNICKENKISYLALFGSHARGEETGTSDIDLLARFEGNITLFDLAHAQNDFEDFFGKPVDLIMEDNLRPRIRPYIINDLAPLYAKR